MIGRIKIELKSGGDVNEEQWQAIQLLFPEKVGTALPRYWWGESITADCDTVIRVTSGKGFTLTVEAFSINNMLSKIRDSYDDEIEQIENYTRGQIVQIHVPNMSLMLVNEVTYLDDGCTEELQKLLDDGWRILAVCPPNSQRRPDYILGRYNKEKYNGL